MARNRSLVVAGFVGALVLGPVPGATAEAISPTRFDDPPPDGCATNGCSLREAILEANASPGDDAITLKKGTYRLTITGTGEDLATSGDLDVTRDDLTLTGAGPEATTIDAGEEMGLAQRVLHIGQFEAGSPPDVAISGLTITGGWANTFPDINGGGIFLEDGNLALADVRLIDNYGGKFGSGGGLQTEFGTTATLTRVEVAENTTTFAGIGAGVMVAGGTVTILSSTIHGNHAMDNGGGIYLNAGLVTVTNSTISENTAVAHGGGIYAAGGAMGLGLVTVSDNVADLDDQLGGDGGGIRIVGASVTIGNSILARNRDASSTGNVHPDCSGQLNSGGRNVIGSTTGCTFVGVMDNVVGDPLLGPLADNGGPTPTHALMKGSPAIDFAYPPPASCDPYDQRGAVRGSACDSGAYELVYCQKVVVNRVGTFGKDALKGTPKADGFLGYNGKDTLKGKKGKDGLCGGPGKDTLKAGGGNDRLNGGSGKDTCAGQAGRDRTTSCEKRKGIP